MKKRVKGRGVSSNETGRYETLSRIECFDHWDEGDLPLLRTHVEVDAAKTVITANQSPDLPFDRSINMYRGCEHGCPYCYARPTHTYLGYSAGLDFETRLLAKVDVAERLREELSAPSYRCRPIALGTNTDPYQPIERNYKLTRGILEVMAEFRHPVQITTKSAAIVRDIDLLTKLAKRNLLQVNVSVATLDAHLSRAMEPRASAAGRRLDAVAELSEAGVPITILVAPVIPGLNDHEIERIVHRCAQAGAIRAEWTMIRLPMEVSELFQQWLEEKFPTKARKVMSLIQQVRRGNDNVSDFFERMRGTGPVAEMIHGRFMMAIRKSGLDRPPVELDRTLFASPASNLEQADLFNGLLT